MDSFDERPDPDALLEKIERERIRDTGKLKIFFGYAAGVGKTYAMLAEARTLLARGVDVVAGYIEPHTRPDTMALSADIPALPPRTLLYRNIELKEFDIDAALERKPSVILVDELAHTNAAGSRNAKRYQDVEELLNAGIDVYSTMNVQHVESLNDIIQRITGVAVRETVPDSIIDRAEKVQLIDIDPAELMKRFAEGKIYKPERATVARQNFFTAGNLSSLREIAMRKAADRVSLDVSRDEKAASEKILVCIGPSPSSASCIRAAARMAAAWHAPWLAVTVVRGDEVAGVRENTALAERLGAKIVSLQGDDIAPTIAEYARVTGVTNIIIGKRKRQDVFKNPFMQDFADKLAYLLPEVEIHIIPDKSTGSRYKKAKSDLPAAFARISVKPRHVAVSLFFLSLATGLSFALRALGIGDHNIIMAYLLSVFAVSRYTEGYLYGAASSVLAVLAFNFFFTEPYYTFNAIQPGYPITFLIMFIVALITSALTVRVKNQARISALRENRTEMLYEINNKLLAACDSASICEIVADQLTGALGREVTLYPADPEASVAPDAGEENARSVVHWVFANRKPAGTGTETLGLQRAYYAPVEGRNGIVGVIRVSCAELKPLTRDNIDLVGKVASLVALAIERQTAADRQRSLELESERERMRYDFLRGISHDLRTPLTAILGASSVLLENGDILDSEARYLFASDIKCDAQWLMRMVENILSVTKISDGLLMVQKREEAVEEVVSEAVSLVRSHFTGIRLNVSIPDELLMVPMDGTLVEQVLINLVENAAKYAGASPLIELRVTSDTTDAIFSVIDDGAGIPEEELAHIFDGPIAGSKKTGDGSRGLGIGLLICATIIKAQGGTISARNRDGHGAEFRFTLPLENGAGNGKQKTDSDR
jgi:two-component system sensor histidine kinase KdpD